MYVIERMFRCIAGAMFAAFVLAAVGMNAAKAQQTQTLTVSAFLANPGQLLKQNPNGGTLLASLVQQFALSDPSTFKVLLGLLADANDAQKGAIGGGLAQAAKIEVQTNQELAEDWQHQIAAINDPIFKTAATNAFGDVQLGLAGGGPLGGVGGGVGGGGGLTNKSTNSGPLEDLRSHSVISHSFTFTSSISAGSSPSSSVRSSSSGPSSSGPSSSGPSSPVSP